MRTLVTSLFILTVFAECNATPPFIKLREMLETMNPPGQKPDLHEAKNQFLSITKEIVASNIAGLGQAFCRETYVDWMGAWNITLELSEKINIEEETLCALISNHIETVLEPVSSRLDQCGAAQRIGPLGTSIVLAFKSLAGHICSITGEQIIEMLNPCVSEGTFRAPQCSQFKQKMQTLTPGHTTDTFVSELCHTLPLAKECILDSIGQNCHLDFTKKAWEELLNAFLYPCSHTQ